MSTRVKNLMQAELKASLEGVNECAIVSIRGIRGTANNKLRGELLDKGIKLIVVKNSLAAAAFAELGMDGMKEVLSGPCSVVYGGDSIVDVVKAVIEAAKEYDKLEVKGGYLDGQPLDAEATKALSKLPSRAELQAAVIMIAKSPGARIAGAINSPAGNIAGCIKTIIEKLEEGQAA
ncbi:MAG: 50S ribosomal protein L10 [Sedimentisphaerales bacterium]|nr:50S ribosomal protein L10 [Sedimentisphaerales bacterium]